MKRLIDFILRRRRQTVSSIISQIDLMRVQLDALADAKEAEHTDLVARASAAKVEYVRALSVSDKLTKLVS